MSAATLVVGNVEITAILDVDTSMPLTEVFDGSSDPPGRSKSLAASIEDREVSPGMSRDAPGHTPGHRCGRVVRERGQRLLRRR
jgi:hypothetical protein